MWAPSTPANQFAKKDIFQQIHDGPAIARAGYMPIDVEQFFSAFAPKSDTDKARVKSVMRSISVKAMDSLDVVSLCDTLGTKVGVLDMASYQMPGGGVRAGARAQEEDICRRTNLLPFLDRAQSRGMYPIPLFGMLYVPGVTVLRRGEASGFEWVSPSTVGKIDVFVAPALRRAVLGPWSPAEKVVMARKIRLMFVAACSRNVRVLVLGAFGCGAYDNPPEEVAELFAATLQECAHWFDQVFFAVLITRVAETANFDAFSRVFEVPHWQQNCTR